MGVAAPLEPTPQDFYDTWHPKKSFAYRSIEEYWFEFSKAYAAAVSKNSEERMQRTIDLLDSELGESMAETKAAEAGVLELEKEIAALRETKP